MKHHMLSSVKSCPIGISTGSAPKTVLEPFYRKESADERTGQSLPKDGRRCIFTIGCQKEEQDLSDLEMSDMKSDVVYSKSLSDQPGYLSVNAPTDNRLFYNPAALSITSLAASDVAGDDCSSVQLESPAVETKCHQIDLQLNEDQTKSVLETFQKAKQKLEELAKDGLKKLEIENRPKCQLDSSDDNSDWELLSQDISFLDATGKNAASILRVFRRRRQSGQITKPTVYKLAQLSSSGALTNAIDKPSSNAVSPVPSQPHRGSLASERSDKSNNIHEERATKRRESACPDYVYAERQILTLVRFQTVGNNLSQQGYTFLNGVERCLLRLKRPSVLQRCIKQLTSNHIKSHNVSVDKMAAAFTVFGTVVIEFLQSKHVHTSVDTNSNDQQHKSKLSSCNICTVWTKFFGLIGIMLISQGHFDE